MSKFVKYVGPDQMPANMFGLPQAVVVLTETALSSDKIVRLRHLFASLYNPPLAFNRAAGEFDYLQDQQSFELFLAGYAFSKWSLPEISEAAAAAMSKAVPQSIPKQNLEVIEEGEQRMTQARALAEQAKQAGKKANPPDASAEALPADSISQTEIDHVLPATATLLGDSWVKRRLEQMRESMAALQTTAISNFIQDFDTEMSRRLSGGR